MDGSDPPPPPPSPYPPSSNLLKDISNYKTPKRLPQIPNSPSQFFTASKQTPRSSYSSAYDSSHRTNRKKTTYRRLKAFEVEQLQSSRKVQNKKEQSLKSLSKSLTTWLNFLLQNPKSCGCNFTIDGEKDNEDGTVFDKLGKRQRDVALWRSPKRQKDESDTVVERVSSSRNYGLLKNSLKDVCSIDDLKERMRVYLSLSNCKEVFDVMSHVFKNIDEGRLKMKAHCPIVTDVGMREKAIRILMCYNPVWLRIGLYIIFGGDSLLPENGGDVRSDQEIAFLKMVIEKQFFSHAGLAKAYAYNKMVEGMYRPGYYENLGNVILKRFLLLVLILDRAKSHSALSLKYGIDGVDGGSPLLFVLQSSVKSSRQMVNDFLSSEIMLGEGNLFAHLVIVGYKVSYQQSPLVEYDYRVVDLFADLQDGVRLCRAIQLLLNDPSILMKMVVPSDSHKKNLANCGIALQYLKHAGVRLCDDDGMMIVEDDVANGDKELTISLLWRMFVHLQLPLLINSTILADEILKIHGTMEPLKSTSLTSSSLPLLLNWIQAVCDKYDYKVDGFSSLLDGKAVWCLLDYYFRKELHCSDSLKDPIGMKVGSIMSAADYTDAVHNFILSQKLITLLGNFPEILQISDILEHSGATSERSVVILLVFLASQLTAKKTMGQLNFHKLLCCNCQSPERRHSGSVRCGISSNIDQEEIDEQCTEDAAKKFNAIKAWWQDMAERNNHFVTNSATSTTQQSSIANSSINFRKGNAAIIIQSYFRRSTARCNFLKIKSSVLLLQKVIRAWFMVKQKSPYKFSVDTNQECMERRIQSEREKRYASFIMDRHNFANLRRAVVLIQHAARIWLMRRVQHQAAIKIQHHFRCWQLKGKFLKQKGPVTKVQRCWRRGIAKSRHHVILQERHLNLEAKAATKIQLSWRDYIVRRSVYNQHLAAIKIQHHFRCWQLRKKFLKQKGLIMKVQRCWRRGIARSRRHAILQEQRRNLEAAAAYKIQLSWKNCVTRRRFHNRQLAAIKIQHHFRCWRLRKKFLKEKALITKVQRWFRSWLLRRNFLHQTEAAIKIQSAIRSLNCRRAFYHNKTAAIEIQRFVRGRTTWKRLLGASQMNVAAIAHDNFQTSACYIQSSELELIVSSILKLQRWWRGLLSLKSRTNSAIIIQSYVRTWIVRRRVSKENFCAVTIQSHWKGYLVRKGTRGQLVDLRLRVQKSAKNIDDSMRIINRLKVALSELLGMKSVSNILHTCATLNTTTQHSQKCCEELVAAGAMDILLKLIRSVSRSIPDQEVLKHALSTIRNLTRYYHLTEVLIDSPLSMYTIFMEFLRNKEEGYFIASEILKKIFLHEKSTGLSKLPALLRRLHSHVDELNRKLTVEKRNPQGVAAREKTERRLKEAVGLLKVMTNN